MTFCGHVTMAASLAKKPSDRCAVTMIIVIITITVLVIVITIKTRASQGQVCNG